MQSRFTVASKVSRPFYLVAGVVFLGLGYLGVVLPVMPGTIFFILALNCFRRSHAGLEAWLLARPVIGPILKNWDETGSISRRVKVIINVVLWLSISGSIASAYRNVHDYWIPISAALVATAAGVSMWVNSRPDA